MPDPKLELNIGGAWTDVTATADVKTEDGITITRGAGESQEVAAPGSLEFTLMSDGLKYFGKLPTSPHFGLLNRNTPVRATATHPTLATPTLRSSAFATGGTSVTVAKPAGTAAGDLLIFYQSCYAAHVGELEPAAGTPAMRLVDQVNAGESDGWLATRVWSRWATSAEPSTYTFDQGGASVGVVYAAAIQNPGYGDVYCLAEDLTPASGTMGTAFTTPSVDPLTDADLEFRFASASDPNVHTPTWTPPAGYTERFDVAPGSGFFTGTGASRVLPSGAPSGDLDFTSTVGTYPYGHGVTVLVSTASRRFWGEVPAWPPRWNIPGTVIEIPIKASGILNRLGSSGQAELASPMYREATRPAVQQFTAALWTCEDGPTAKRFGSALPGVPALVYLDSVDPGQTSTIPGARAMGRFGSDGSLHARIPFTVDTIGKVFFRIVLDVPDSPSTPDGTNILNIYLTGSTMIRCALHYLTAGGGALEARAIDPDQMTIESASLGGGINGTRFYLSIELVQSGLDIAFLAGRNTISADNSAVSSSVFLDTWAGMVVGRPYALSAGSMDGWGFCFIGLGNDQQFMFSMASALVGNAGETAGARMLRVAAEAGIALRILGDPADTALMGSQIPGTPLAVLRSCAKADGGILYESRNELGLTYRTQVSLQNQTGPALDYAAGHVATIEPTEDDQLLANDITVTRVGGSFARATLDVGSLSTREPPDGAGRIAAPEHEVAVLSDLQLDDIATWRRHILTWDEQRYKALGFQAAAIADPALVAQLVALDSGDLVSIANPPAWLPPGPISQLIRGYTEDVAEGGAAALWQIDWNAEPAGPWQIAVWGQSRWDTSGSEIAVFVDTVATSISVATLKGLLWTTNPARFPFDIKCTGETMTVDDVFGPPTNFLGTNNSTFDANIGSWTGAGNANVAQSTAQAYGGAGSMAMTAVAAGSMAAAHCTSGAILTSGMACSPGDTIVTSAWLRAATTGRSVQVGAQFYDSGGTSLGAPIYGATVTDTTTGWVKATASVTAPASSSRCRMVVNVVSAGGAGEVHYVDDAGIGNATTGSTSQQTMFVARGANGTPVKNHGVGAPVSLADRRFWSRSR